MCSRPTLVVYACTCSEWIENSPIFSKMNIHLNSADPTLLYERDETIRCLAISVVCSFDFLSFSLIRFLASSLLPLKLNLHFVCRLCALVLRICQRMLSWFCFRLCRKRRKNPFSPNRPQQFHTNVFLHMSTSTRLSLKTAFFHSPRCAWGQLRRREKYALV